jgi:Domain of unknown function (DU1801)
MGKYEPKTKASRASVADFINRIPDPERRADCRTLVRMMKAATGKSPKMWATMIGFGDFHYRYASGHEGDTFAIGFASRRPDLVLYLLCGLPRQQALLAKLGKHRKSVSCLYVRRLADVDLRVLKKLIAATVRWLNSRPR